MGLVSMYLGKGAEGAEAGKWGGGDCCAVNQLCWVGDGKG